MSAVTLHVIHNLVVVMSVYLHVLVSCDPAQFIQCQDVETLTENRPLNFDYFTISCKAKGGLPLVIGAARDTSKLSQEGSSWDATRKVNH